MRAAVYVLIATVFSPLAAAAATGREPHFSIQREIFPLPPAKTVLAATYYTQPTGVELLSVHQVVTRSDTFASTFYRHSPDNGRTWTEPKAVWTEKAAESMGRHRRIEKGVFLDPQTGHLISFRIEAYLPTDNPIEGLRQWAVYYSVSEDGGRTWRVDEQVIHRGPEYSPAHPLPDVWSGKNCYMIGDLGSEPITLPDGTILVPIQISPIGPEGVYHNPGGGLSYTDAAVLRGRWRSDGRLEWELSALAKGDPALTTRGMIEPTLARLTDGRVLMVMRGSNDKRPHLFGGRWVSFSSDEGRTWTEPRLWTYTDGEKFYSPSSCSQLLAHSSGRLFWIGNISPGNPKGNRPRNPLVIGEVDRSTGLLRKATIAVVDDRRPGDSEMMTLSNFHAREDRETGEIVVNLTREAPDANPARDQPYLYRIKLLSTNPIL